MMISFNSDMQKEKLAAIGLAVIIIGALSTYLIAEHWDEILENLSENGEKENTIELGDCADVNYVGKLANGTVFDTSYEDVAKEWGLHVEGREYSPLKFFVTLNMSMFPPEGYDDYQTGIEGFMEGLVGLKEGEKSTIGPISPEKAYGKLPEVGDVIDVSDPSLGETGFHIEFVDIIENASVPAGFETLGLIEGDNTTLYVLKDISHYVGEIMPFYPSWENATVITKMNNTKVWFVTNPPEDKMNNFTWQELSATGGIQSYWKNASNAVINESNNTITITHSPQEGQTLNYYGTEFIVVNLTDDKINCSYIGFDGNISYMEYDRIITIEINQTENITYSWPPEVVDYILSILKQVDPTISYSLGYLAGETLTFEVEIVKVYKTS